MNNDPNNLETPETHCAECGNDLDNHAKDCHLHKLEAWNKATLETQILEPGIYVLTETVTNGHVDRRHKHDWRKAEGWTKGTRFEVTEAIVDENGKGLPWPAMIYKKGQWSHQQWRLDSDEAKQILEKLTPEKKNLRNVLEADQNHAKARALDALQILVARGLVKLSDVEDALQATPEEEKAAMVVGGWKPHND